MTEPADNWAHLACLPPEPRSVTLLPGGLTNVNYVVRGEGSAVVVRVLADSADGLAINREHEFANSELAAESGIAPPALEYHAVPALLVVGYVPGRTLTADGTRDAAMIPRLAAACRTLHAGAAFVSDFDMFEVGRRYRSVAARLGATLPDGYDGYDGVLARIEAALRKDADPVVPCHNDLLAANFIDDGDRIWMIDWEYSGNNDPTFELGNLAGENGFSADQLTDLVTAYYGRPRPSRVARARLWTAVGQYGWTLWGVIQQATSSLDEDFLGWGLERFDKARLLLDGPELPELLEAAAQPD